MSRDGVIPAYQVFPKGSSIVRTASESAFYNPFCPTKRTVHAAPIILFMLITLFSVKLY